MLGHLIRVRERGISPPASSAHESRAEPRAVLSHTACKRTQESRFLRTTPPWPPGVCQCRSLHLRLVPAAGRTGFEPHRKVFRPVPDRRADFQVLRPLPKKAPPPNGRQTHAGNRGYLMFSKECFDLRGIYLHDPIVIAMGQVLLGKLGAYQVFRFRRGWRRCFHPISFAAALIPLSTVASCRFIEELAFRSVVAYNPSGTTSLARGAATPSRPRGVQVANLASGVFPSRARAPARRVSPRQTRHRRQEAPAAGTRRTETATAGRFSAV
jgi:hypothetical protein